MDPQALSMLKGLVSASGRAGELKPFLPKAAVDSMEKIPQPANFDPHVLFSSDQWLKPIHFSWFAQTLKEYPGRLQTFFLGVLPHKHVLGGVRDALPL